MGNIETKVVIEEYDVYKFYIPAPRHHGRRHHGRRRHGACYSISQSPPPHASAVLIPPPPPPPPLASHHCCTDTSVCTTWESNATPKCIIATPTTSTQALVTIAKAENPKKKILGLRYVDTGVVVPIIDDKGAYVPEDTKNKIWVPSMKMWIGGPECVFK